MAQYRLLHLQKARSSLPLGEVAEGTRELLPSLIASIPEKVTECRRITLGISKVCSFEHPTRTKRRTQMIQCMATGKRTAAGKGRPETSS